MKTGFNLFSERPSAATRVSRVGWLAWLALLLILFGFKDPDMLVVVFY